MIRAANDDINKIRRDMLQLINAHQDNIQQLAGEVLKSAKPKWCDDDLRRILKKYAESLTPIRYDK